jgi:hypothetical protein
MKAGKYTEEEIIAVLKEGEAGTNTADLCRNGIAAQPGSGWQSLQSSSLSPVRPELVEG